MLADVGAHPLASGVARLLAAGLLERGEGFERKLGVDRQDRSSPGKRMTQSGRDLLESVNWNS